MEEFIKIFKPEFNENGNIDYDYSVNHSPEEIADKIYEYFEWAISNNKPLMLEKVFLILRINQLNWDSWKKFTRLNWVVKWVEAVLEEDLAVQRKNDAEDIVEYLQRTVFEKPKPETEVEDIKDINDYLQRNISDSELRSITRGPF